MYDHDGERIMTYDVIEYKPKRRRRLVKFVAVCVAISCFGASFGYGLGLSGVFSALPLADGAGQGAPPAASEAFAIRGNTPLAGEPVNLMNNIGDLTGSNGVADVVRQSSKSVVSINVSGTARNMFNRARPFESAGSGIIIGEADDKLYIVTNHHVIRNADTVTISVGCDAARHGLTDNRKLVTASYVGSDFESDLAVISVDKADMADVPFEIAETGNSDMLDVGEIVIAIGNALGGGMTATMGIISAKNRQLSIERRNITVLQTDAAINPGNSGGALVNMNAEVIAINTAKLKEIGVEGMGYAIPINEALVTIEQLIENGATAQPGRPYLGIQGRVVDEQLRDENNLPSVGIYVHSVMEGSGAEVAGIRRGDIIVGFGERTISHMEDLQEALQASRVGDVVEVAIYRNGVRVRVQVTLRNANQRF